VLTRAAKAVEQRGNSLTAAPTHGKRAGWLVTPTDPAFWIFHKRAVAPEPAHSPSANARKPVAAPSGAVSPAPPIPPAEPPPGLPLAPAPTAERTAEHIPSSARL